MQRPCDICVDPQCGGKQDCKCETCDKRETCPRLLGIKPTFRITRKCTQSCSHCCFECSPNRTEMMTVETARDCSQFCRANSIRRCEIMGGEFFCNPDWEAVMDALVEDMLCVRLVTNGDWAGKKALAERVIKFLSQHPKRVYVSLSKDRWHTNRHVSRAAKLLKEAGIPHNVATEEQTTNRSLVPVGRLRLEFTDFFSMWGCYCYEAEKKYSLLIDEQGEIYKCGMGAWPYDNISGFLDGGFAARFKYFNGVFYKCWLPNCRTCQRQEEYAKHSKEKTG